MNDLGSSGIHQGVLSSLIPVIGKMIELRKCDRVSSISIVREDIEALYQKAMKGLQTHSVGSEEDAKKYTQNISQLLCSYIDEAVLATNWGIEGNWISMSFLSTHHANQLGGEYFYKRLKECMDEPGEHLTEITMFYLFLASGYRGKMRLLKDGPHHIEQLMHRIYRNVIEINSDFPTSLCHQNSKIDRKKRLPMMVFPLTFFLAISASLVCLYEILNQQSGIQIDRLLSLLGA